MTRPPAAGSAIDAALVDVLPKPGVTDPVAASTLAAIKDFGIAADAFAGLLATHWGWAGGRCWAA